MHDTHTHTVYYLDNMYYIYLQISTKQEELHKLFFNVLCNTDVFQCKTTWQPFSLGINSRVSFPGQLRVSVLVFSASGAHKPPTPWSSAGKGVLHDMFGGSNATGYDEWWYILMFHYWVVAP